MSEAAVNTTETPETPRPSEASEASTPREARQRGPRGKVVDYADADAETKAKMEVLMEEIDKAPDSFDAIVNYGNPPLKALGEIANDLMRVQGQFNDQVNVMATAMERLQNGMKKLDFETFGQKTQELLKGLANTGAEAAVGVGGKVRDIGLALIGKRKKRDTAEDEKILQDMQSQLPQMFAEMLTLVDAVEGTDEGLKSVIEQAKVLGLARVTATAEINLYLGASKEVLRRYNEEYIPQAQENCDNGADDPEAQMYLEGVLKGKERFMNRIAVLEGSRGQSHIAAQQLRQMIDTMEDQRAKIRDILENGQNEWKAMLASAGIAGSSLKAAQTLERADNFGDKMHDETMKMVEEAHAKTQDAKARGTIDPKKIIEGAQRMSKLLESEARARVESVKQLEQTTQQLRTACDKLIESAEKTQEARTLEGTAQAKLDAQKAQQAALKKTPPAPQPQAPQPPTS